MPDGSIADAFTNKIGPLQGWQWVGIVGAGALGLMMLKGKKAVPGAAPGATGPAGEFSSSQTEQSTDPVTGKSTSSQYQATGPLAGGWGGSVGLPMGYPMPTSGGDVYVNLPGDTQNTQPQLPATGTYVPAHYPPTGNLPNPGANWVGGYWWTPSNLTDAAHMVSHAYGMKAEEQITSPFDAMNYAVDNSAIREANPQIDWTRGLDGIVGKPIYIPKALGNWQDGGRLPAGATRAQPDGYAGPPTQTTTVAVNGQ